jgi:hypothetical protein
MIAAETCACGRPLHYSDPAIYELIAGMVRELGPTIKVICAGKSYQVQRHFIALHGLKAAELPMLARAGIVEEIKNPPTPRDVP